uniref:protein-histidine N-methyltransferase n=1 Tax=Anopheles funestus TaxID=62324 RepID=A0A182RGG9_ANOFN
MFKFTFQIEPDKDTPSVALKDEETKPSAEADESSTTVEVTTDVYPCEELTFQSSVQESPISPDVTSTFSPAPDYSIDYLNQLALLDETFADDIVTAESDHSDLVPNRYEGGLKVWECTYDLGEYLAATDERKAELHGKKVLDLGCGAGILGIEALLLGSSCNKDVLTKLTMVNYDLNCRLNETDAAAQESPTVDVKFFSGDWGCFTDKYKHTYDLILTSETIYSTQNYTKLLTLFDRKLVPDGVVYIAAKTYYFGVGGGVRLFEQAIDKDGRFRHEVVWKCDTGVKREIVRLTRK